jgi:mannose-1-phosphate guanylyltransferase
MKPSDHMWAIVLAAGEGSRLRALTTQKTGQSVPKQFCTLRGGPTLLDEAMQRAAKITARDRICPIVAEQHRNWWQPLVARLPPGNLIVQPANRGTAIGILYAVLYVLARDPKAHVVLIPADHFVADEAKLQEAMEAAIQCACAEPAYPVLLGLEPEEPDTELGYILPGPGDSGGSRQVQEFVEKPTRKAAQRLVQQGGLWNAFIVATSGRGLIDAFFARRFASIIAQMDRFLGRVTAEEHITQVAWSDLVSIYQRFPVIDFSRNILTGREASLRVVTAAACGWTDLGTPRRVAEALQRLRAAQVQRPETMDGYSPGALNLATQHARIEREPAQV